MAKHQGETFRKQKVRLDDGEFVDCRFENCAFEYTGGVPPTMVGCKFDQFRPTFSGAASNTVNFMRAIYHGFGSDGRTLIEKTFEMIQQPFGDEKLH
jgi:hypothetical protein